MKIGDWVEVDIGMGLGAKGQIVTESDYMSSLREQRTQSLSLLNRNSNGSSYRISFLDGSTHTASEHELRLLSGKEAFVLKLKGKGDEEMAKIYEAMDERD
jgi:hypothetical protein